MGVTPALNAPVSGAVDAGLVLAALVIALPVLHHGVVDMEVGQQLLGDGVALRYMVISSFMRR